MMVIVLDFFLMILAAVISGVSFATQDNQMIGVYWSFVALYWDIRIIDEVAKKNEMDDH